MRILLTKLYKNIEYKEELKNQHQMISSQLPNLHCKFDINENYHHKITIKN